MTATSEPRLKITYATLRNDNEQLHASYDAGLAIARGELGGTHGVFINGEWLAPKVTFEKRSTMARSSATSPGERVRTFGTPSPPPAPPRLDGPARPGANAWRSCAGWPT